MARQESDREDLLREATALVERAELQLAGESETFVIGFRRDGAGSIFFGSEPVYQFNAAGELRRGYWRGMLIKAERGELVSLLRQRTTEQVQLVRHQLTAIETAEYLHELQARLAKLVNALRMDDFCLIGQVPDIADVLSRILAWLLNLPHPPRIAARPNSG